MRFKASNLELKKLLSGNTELVLEIDDKQNTLIKQIGEICETAKDGFEVVLDKWLNKRSNNHNRLFWDMCGELAEVINDPLITQYEIYRNLIREYGVSTIHPVKDDLLEMEIKVWESRGDGWLTQQLRKSKLDGNYTNVKFWFGSSVYNSKQFWNLVEGLKALCRDYKLDISHYDRLMTQSLQKLEEKEKEAENGNNS